MWISTIIHYINRQPCIAYHGCYILANYVHIWVCMHTIISPFASNTGEIKYEYIYSHVKIISTGCLMVVVVFSSYCFDVTYHDVNRIFVVEYIPGMPY